MYELQYDFYTVNDPMSPKISKELYFRNIANTEVGLQIILSII